MPGEQIWPDRRTEQWCSSGRKILTSVQGLRSFSESSTGKPMLSFQYHASSEMRGCLSFTMGASADVNGFFGVMTMVIAVPTGVKVFNWLFTMYGGRIRFTVPILWSIGFMVTFVIGGMTGVLMAV